MKDSFFRHNHSTTHALSAIGTLWKKIDKLMTSGLEKLFLLGNIPWFTEKAFVFWYFNGDIPPKKLEYYENTEVSLIIGFSHMYLNEVWFPTRIGFNLRHLLFYYLAITDLQKAVEFSSTHHFLDDTSHSYSY